MKKISFLRLPCSLYCTALLTCAQFCYFFTVITHKIQVTQMDIRPNSRLRTTHLALAICGYSSIFHHIPVCIRLRTKLKHEHISNVGLRMYNAHSHLGLMSFFSWCLNHAGVGDCGQPMRVWYQLQHTEDNRVNGRCSRRLNLAVMYGRPSAVVECT